MIIVHIHIPRTAGANLGIVLRAKFKCEFMHYPFERFGEEESNYNPKEAFFIRLASRIKKAEKEHEDIYVQGHILYGIHRYIDSPVKYFTMLRDPVKRIWSRYNSYKNAQSYAIHKYWKRKYEFNFKKMMEAGELELCNDQTRMIIGTCRKKITEVDAGAAIKKLFTEYVWVGTTEDFWKSGSEFSKAIGIPKIRFNETRVNSVQYTIGRHPSPEQKQLIIECNLQDQKVYEYVRDCRAGLIADVPLKVIPATVLKVDALTDKEL